MKTPGAKVFDTVGSAISNTTTPSRTQQIGDTDVTASALKNSSFGDPVMLTKEPEDCYSDWIYTSSLKPWRKGSLQQVLLLEQVQDLQWQVTLHIANNNVGMKFTQTAASPPSQWLSSRNICFKIFTCFMLLDGLATVRKIR